MRAHVYWMQGWRNAPPRAVRNVLAWREAGFEVLAWDDTNEGHVLPAGYEWHPGIVPAMRCDIVLALAQLRYGGLALGADMSPIRPAEIVKHVATLPEGVGMVVWQKRQERPYNGGSWFPKDNKFLRLLCIEHRRTLDYLRDGPHPNKAAHIMTGPEKWNDMIKQRPDLWRNYVDVVQGSEVFLFEPRHPDLRSPTAWLDAGFTGDWNGTKKEAWL